MALKIISLIVENFKKIRAVEIKPSGATVTITGKNRQGKSSILDGIMVALGGVKYMPEKPIREGAEKALIQIDCGEFTLERRITKSGTTLKIESKDGTVKSPQAFLDKIIGEIAFDPLDFIRREPKQQRKILADLTGANTEKLDAEIRTLREVDRLTVGRERDRLKTLTDNSIFTSGLPEDEISSASILEKIDAAAIHNKTVDDLEAKVSRIDEWTAGSASRVEGHKNRLYEIEQEFARLKVLADAERAALNDEDKNMEKASAAKSGHQAAISAAPRQDDSVLRSELSGLAAKNKLIAANRNHAANTSAYKAKAKEYDKLTRQIEDLESQKTQLLVSAKMPIEGLAFGEDCLLYNRIPLSQVSDSEKIKIGIAIAMKLNPVLRVIRITDGSLLDSETMAEINKMVSEGEYQLWIERVEDSGKVGIVIEDGSIKE